MADMMSTLKGILGDGAEEKIKSAMELLGAGSNFQDQSPEVQKINNLPKDVGQSFNPTPESIEMITQLKGMVDRISNTNDSRSELLRSLRPFVRTERQKSIDKAIKLINIGRVSGIIGK